MLQILESPNRYNVQNESLNGLFHFPKTVEAFDSHVYAYNNYYAY